MKKFTLLLMLALFLKIAVGQVTVTITVQNNLSPSTKVSGASVTLTGATIPTLVSDVNGLAVFTVPTPTVAGFYNIAITAAGYLDYANTSLVYLSPTSTTVSRTATIRKAFDITYKITDKNSVGVSGASVRINTTPATTLTTNANGDVTFPGLYSVGNHSTLVTANGYADSTFNVNVLAASPNPFIVPAVKLRNAYTITFTVTDGTNPVSGALVTIGTTAVTTDASGVAVFAKKVNGAYVYGITKTGFMDKTGNVTVTDGDQNPAITLSAGYDLTFTIINGATGTTGLQKDTITIDGITKITDATGILTFGVAPGSSYSFDNKKAGFITVPVSVTNIQANTAITLNMVPVYTVKFTVSDFWDASKQAGVKVTFNGTDIITDATGVAKFIDVQPSATPYAYTISGPDGSSYITQTGTISAPLTSTTYLFNNNNLTKNINYERPYAYIGLSSGMMSYFGVATITFNGVDYPYDAGMGGNTFFVASGTYNYTVTPADVTKAIISGTVTVPNTTPGNAYVSIVAGKKIEMYVVDATIDQNTIDGALITLDGVTQTTVDGYVVFDRKAINKDYSYTISKPGYGTVTDTANLVTADLIITTVLNTAYKITAKVYDNTTWTPEPVGLAGATVVFNGSSVLTDANGVATLPDAANGMYEYTISKAGFVTVKGTAVVDNADVTFEAWLNPAFSVQFTVTDGTNPVANANIRLVSTWPVFDQTFVTDAQGVLLTDKLFPKWTSLEYTVSAAGFADSIGSVNIADMNLIVDPIALKHAYEITFTVNDGTNPVSDAAISINNVTKTTNAGGDAVFTKMINGDYSYVVSKPGFSDMAGTVTVTDANAAKTVSLAMGYNVTFNVFNGPVGSVVGLANDTITINGISKVTDAAGTVIFGVAPNAAISFVNSKAGFESVPVDIASVTSDMSQVINMIPVYSIEFRAVDNFTYNPIAGATVIFNGVTVTTNVDGFAYFTNIAPGADVYGYSVSGNGSYTTVTGELTLPFTSTEDLLMNNNNVQVRAELSSPGVYMALVSGMMSYFGQATITLDGTDYAYDPGLGSVVINCALGSHSYIVTPEDINKAIVRGTVTVTSSVEKTFVEVKISAARKIEIYTIDAASEPIEGASVTLSGHTVLTDASGLALFDRYAAGSYTYSVTMENYKSVAETALDVNTENVMVIVPMEKSSFMVTIHVMSGSDALEGATVTLDGVTVTSDANGDAAFTGLVAGTYAYTVSKDVYTTATGSITLTNLDVIENVEILSTVGINGVNAKMIKLYPNPTNGILNISLPENNGKGITIKVTNVIGKVVLENKVINSSNQSKLDLSGFDSGIYFVKVIGNGFENTVKVVKN